jgi:hypothetical protein
MLAMVAVISAGCSNAPAGTGTGNSTVATHQKAVKFAECMRNNGVSEFPDPDASGTFAYGIKRGSSLDPSTAAWKKAISACKDLEPPGALGDGKQSATSRTRLWLYAARSCRSVTPAPRRSTVTRSSSWRLNERKVLGSSVSDASTYPADRQPKWTAQKYPRLFAVRPATLVVGLGDGIDVLARCGACTSCAKKTYAGAEYPGLLDPHRGEGDASGRGASAPGPRARHRGNRRRRSRRGYGGATGEEPDPRGVTRANQGRVRTARVCPTVPSARLSLHVVAGQRACTGVPDGSARSQIRAQRHAPRMDRL